MTDLRAVALQLRIEALGESIWEDMGGVVPGIFDKRHWQARLLDWAMCNPQFKTDLFRFIDVLPALHSSKQVADHAREYLLSVGGDCPEESVLCCGRRSAVSCRVRRQS